MSKQKFEIPEGSQAYIVANLPKGEKDAIVVYKGNVRKLITLFAFAGAKIAEQLQKDGLTDLQIRDAMVGTFTTAIDEAIRDNQNRTIRKNADALKQRDAGKRKEGQKYVNHGRFHAGTKN